MGLPTPSVGRTATDSLIGIGGVPIDPIWKPGRWRQLLELDYGRPQTREREEHQHRMDTAHSFPYDRHARLEGVRTTHIKGIFEVWAPWPEHAEASTKAPPAPGITPSALAGNRLAAAATGVENGVWSSQNARSLRTVRGGIRSG